MSSASCEQEMQKATGVDKKKNRDPNSEKALPRPGFFRTKRTHYAAGQRSGYPPFGGDLDMESKRERAMVLSKRDRLAAWGNRVEIYESRYMIVKN